MSKSAFESFGATLDFKPAEVSVTTASGRVFTLVELDGAAHRMVDRSTKEFSAIDIAYTRVAASITTIQGQKVPDFSEPKDFDRLLKLLRGSELDELLGAYGKAFTPRGEELKNDLAAEAADTAESPTPASPE